MLTYERAKEVFTYDPETGILYRKLSRGKPRKPRPVIVPDKQGYLVVCVDSKHQKVHRIVWLMEYGFWPKGNIDHIDGNRTNNKLSNLRDVTFEQNAHNATLRKDNTSGFKGVHFHRNHNKWVARVHTKGRSIHLGCFLTPEEAHLAYCEAAAKYFGEHFCDGKR